MAVAWGKSPLTPALSPPWDRVRGLSNRLKRMIPLAGVHIDGPHLHAMLTRIAHQLGGRVKAHGLAVQNRGGEHVGVIALQPGRAVDEQREGSRVAFGKA